MLRSVITAAPARRSTAVLLAGVLALLLLAGCTPAPPDDVVRVGAGSTTEQQVLAALTLELLRREEVPVEVVPELGDTARVRGAALDGDVDVYWDYSGAAWAMALGLTAPPVDATDSFEAVAAEELDRGLRWLGPTQVDARLALFVPADRVPAEEEPTVTWLASTIGADGTQEQAGAGVLCADAGYLSAPSGYAYLADVYAIGTSAVTTVAAGEVAALERTAAGECTAGLASATSGTGRQLGLVPLRDDQGVFPALALAPVVPVGGRADVAAVRVQLERLADLLTTEVLAGLSAMAAEGTPIDQIAAGFLDDVGSG